MITGKQSKRPPHGTFRDPFPLEEWVIFGSNVERIRTDQQLSITRFCEMAGISRPTLYKIERGEGDPKLSMMVKIAKALDVEVQDLLDPYLYE